MAISAAKHKMRVARQPVLTGGAIVLLCMAGCDGSVLGKMGSPATPIGPDGRPISPGAGGGAPMVFDPLNPLTPSQLAELYFPGDVSVLAKKRVARLTRAQIDATTRFLLPTHVAASVAATFPRDPLQTNYEYADNLQVGPSNFTPYAQWVEKIATSVKAKPDSVINCAASNNSTACLQTQADAFLTKAFRGAVSAARQKAFVDFYLDSVSQVGFQAATGDLVEAALNAPGYLFRDEVSADSMGLLLPAQRLQALAFTLADVPPDALSLASTHAEDIVKTPESTAQAIEKVLTSAQAREKLTRFFTAWLEIREPQDFAISTAVFPEFTAALTKAMLEETNSFLASQLSKAAPVLKDVTQSTQSFVSPALSALYGPSQKTGSGLVDLDATQRLGVFTQPSMIASHSGPTTTRLVKRGVFFTRKIMCVDLAPPPQGTDTSVPTATEQTERARIEGVTTSAKCVGCHSRINPFGFSFENYDAIGRWRTTDEGIVVDPKVTFDFLEEGPMTTKTPVEALKTITSSSRFKQCFVRQLFRFYSGREETAADSPLLRQMFLQFIENDEQDIVKLLRLLANSGRVTQRMESP